MTRRGQHTRQSPVPEQPSPNADPEQANAAAADPAGVSESGPPAGWVGADDGSWAPPADPEADGGEPDPVEQTTDYTRCGGHVLTDYGWVPEDQAEQ